MKKLLLMTLALSLSTQVMSADNNKERKKHNREADSAAEARSQQNGPARQATLPQIQQKSQQQARPRASTTQRTFSSAPRTVAASPRGAVQSEAQLDGRNRVQPSNRAVTRDGNVNRNVNRSGNRNVNRDSFATARSRVVRTSHNRNWWHSHYNTTFVLFGGGYYYWWDGYWFPAFGYSPYDNNYLYSEPIYGYDNLDPGQVIENVQLALRDQGYYPGAIDGLVGPQTRSALAAFQRDHGLLITEAVDEPTLVTLGLA